MTKYELVTDGQCTAVKRTRYICFVPFVDFYDLKSTGYWWVKTDQHFVDCWTTNADYAAQILRRLTA